MKYMKRVSGSVFILVILAGLWVPPLAAQDDGLQPGLAMAVKKVSILEKAEAGTAKLASLEIGELVNVLEVGGGWAHIEYGDIVGWVRPTVLINVNGPTPAARGYHAMTYDVESDRVILFGGLANNADVDDTWTYDVGTNTWTKMAPEQAPTMGEGPIAYDSQSDRTIRFLCPIKRKMPTGEPSETWAYDFNTNTWTNMDPENAPPPLAGARMVYDAESDRMILFGGLDVINEWAYSNETWAYDYDTNTWTQMDPEVSPPGVNYQPMAYDAGADRVIMIGSGEPTLKNDTWVYDYDTNTWTQLEPDTSPSERGWHAMAYSTATDQVVLFGGGQSRLLTTMETWLYDPEANTWTQVGP